MAIAAMKWAHRAVNLATCEKGAVVCEDVTNCGGAACGPCRLPRYLLVSISFAGGGSVVVDTLNPGFSTAVIPIPGPGRSLCNGTTAHALILQASVACDARTVNGHVTFGGTVVWAWDNGFIGDTARRCGGGTSFGTLFDAPDFDPCARPFSLLLNQPAVTVEDCGQPFSSPPPCQLVEAATITVTEVPPPP